VRDDEADSVIRREYSMKFGTQILPEGVRFRLWAPKMAQVAVRIDALERTLPMQRLARGWHEAVVAEARAGMRYRFVLEDETALPDPAARFQPEDVNGPSEIIDPLDFAWTDRGWTGHAWDDTILYELHIGTFTPEGTFRAAIRHLDHLVALGINTLQIMPVADFPGRWNWGYDGASLFAPDHAYGRPEDFKALINAAHGRGLSVMLDVVYNHFGPRGNHIETYAPLTNADTDTPWGPAINFDAEGSAMVRDFVLANARYWLTEYHLDGLRLDAAHEIYDSGPRHILLEFAEHSRAATDGRHVHLVQENSNNQAGWLKRYPSGAPWLYDAQWSDDIHHALHGVITEERGGFYADYVGRTDLAGRALAEGAAWQGEYLQHEQRHKGEPSTFLPTTAFVSFMQNHDQVGNRPWGERIDRLIKVAAMRMWAAIILLSPPIPMLFMGEEWAASAPFLFFSDIGDDLAASVRESRAEQASRYPDARQDDLPDPMAEETYQRSKLDWDEPARSPHAETLLFYRRLIEARRRWLIPRLAGMEGYMGHYEVIGPKGIRVSWTLGDGSVLVLHANLSDTAFAPVALPVEGRIWTEGGVADQTLGPWTCVFTLTEPDGSGAKSAMRSGQAA